MSKLKLILMENFLHEMPKIELHAHLNGSLNTKSILELGEFLNGANSEEFLQLTRRFIDFDGLSLNDCFEKFKFMHELTATPKGLRMATSLVIRDFALDNVIYLELRTTPKANEHMTKREYLECVIETLEKVGDTFKNMKVKLLPSIDRSQSVAAAEETLAIVIDLRKKHSDIVTGIDFSGNPNCGQFKAFMKVLDQARNNGLKLTLHSGETNNTSEIAEMLEYGMDRCGHGTFLNLTQIQELGRQNAAIECCLTSNVKSGTVTSYNDHHFKTIFETGNAVAAVICTDDSGVFDTTLTQEFLVTAITFGLQKEDIRRLTLNAIDHAFTDVSEKVELRNKIIKYFTQNQITTCS